jgi:4-hydroxybenzoate polyprenyltransferase
MAFVIFYNYSPLSLDQIHLLLSFILSVDQIHLLLFFMVVGLAGFSLSYSSVYILNDILDEEVDKDDPERYEKNPIAKGEVSRRQGIQIWLILVVSGLVLSFFVGLLFLVCGVLLLIINILYSLPSTLRNQRAFSSSPDRSLGLQFIFLAIIAVMQFLKQVLPWLVFGDFTNFPYILVIGYALFYTAFFRRYKIPKNQSSTASESDSQQKGHTIGDCVVFSKPLFLVPIITFIVSIFVHPLPYLQIALLMLLLVAVRVFWNFGLKDEEFRKWGFVYFMFALVVLLCVWLFFGSI